MIKVQDTKGNTITIFTLENSGENYKDLAEEFALKHGYIVLKEGKAEENMEDKVEETKEEPKKKTTKSKK